MTDPIQHLARVAVPPRPPAELQALVRALPHCACGQPAEVELRGHVACQGCAASTPHAATKELAHVPAMLAIIDALSPFDVSGTWEAR